MGEKVYKPNLKDGHHLLHSKAYPERYRGTSMHENTGKRDINE